VKVESEDDELEQAYKEIAPPQRRIRQRSMSYRGRQRAVTQERISDLQNEIAKSLQVIAGVTEQPKITPRDRTRSMILDD
jgi:hypothetical protein